MLSAATTLYYVESSVMMIGEWFEITRKEVVLM
jgi:hypothetical protein